MPKTRHSGRNRTAAGSALKRCPRYTGHLVLFSRCDTAVAKTRATAKKAKRERRRAVVAVMWAAVEDLHEQPDIPVRCRRPRLQIDDHHHFVTVILDGLHHKGRKAMAVPPRSFEKNPAWLSRAQRFLSDRIIVPDDWTLEIVLADRYRSSCFSFRD